MTEPEERDPARRPRSVELAALAWAVVGAVALLFVVVNLFRGIDPASPANSAGLFGGLTVLWCAKNLRMGWRGPRIYLTVVGLALTGYAAVVLLALVSWRVDSVVLAYLSIMKGLFAAAGSVLMFRPDANAFVREMTRR
ncbi:hypothetical protein [Allokutzneria albata]|uniref:hypothetical protein n=1 Tax=Allokutzneria albata TaxID=211114 RepID=UPI0004C3643E|nr:hypothetical protein [Allokutzneria albata]